MIIINNLDKYYGKTNVLKNINLKIEKSKITYLVGPNGSGKSTLIKAILGLIKKYSGTIEINGKIINGESDYRKIIGYMPQSASFPENLLVKDIIKMVKDVRNQKEFDEELLHDFSLEKEKNKKLKNLSGGTVQKVNAAIAFLFDPQILILDEPTSGLDPVSSNLLKNKILKENKKGKTILFTSHIISELEDLAQNIAFLLEGNLWFNGSKDELNNLTNEKNLEKSIASIMQKNNK
ncbi:MAG: ATP-binding cassette domain-containing protein [Ignavibacteriales bacterium]|jgi:Cu-processing system ATP-binding protein|nr:ATP-binding cassette domain-containing protein [Ignavibacteriales bacterium]MBK7979016.1 ATP-binding cassette domain-containing protein [Ignavibacteriota bacterium]